MTRRPWWLALPVALAVVLTGCGQSAGKDPANIEGITWVLTEFADDQDSDPTVVSTVALRDERLGGNGGVNDLLGSYAADAEGNLTFSEVNTTKKAGTPEATEQETRLLKVLTEVASFEYDEADGDDPAELEMKDSSGRTILTFVEKS